MEVAKVTSKGQVTIPRAVRSAMNIKAGTQLFFDRQGDQWVITNGFDAAVKHMQEAFVGEAERLGLKNIDDVVDLVKGVRKKMWKDVHEGNVRH
jgi:AbrB family looped-hinge helix DNA binding protein